ncbi:MAG TPA: DUF3568 family protein [Methylomirabilota bacterium]|nr:DUF3568 family protein [Methylomirabilota bacterium]
MAVLAGSQGCAALGLAILSAGVGTGTGQGVAYTLDSIVYKTFTTPVENLESATLKSLQRMDIQVTEREKTDSGLKISAKAGDRDVDIELDRLTSQTARMRVNASLNWFLRDRATAAEVIAQTAQTLDDQARLAQARAARPAAARPAPVPLIKAQPVSATAR